ncbi:hypothetical protein BGW36DRAFT_358858 [Talaromyces proteolyticus]|uniref:Cupin type-2 domain-containing protein n=1 Tax=Talaromyces proteolyticus TaxID=1131652 RepID=A0AAD4KNQ6_9EURO|nr:uncharacterized protein BGW36DRAFT_358858 [Talaromyces proteolyticus]KAH8697043.1 hypothetical protein BGW36DRAFT_358858 [Talaromyces proteolyticus]
MSLFPDPRRIVTGHDANGNAIVLKDSNIPCVPTPLKANFAVLWETHQFPANNEGDEDPVERETSSLANDKGLVLRVVDFPPHTDTLVHRTVSLDFGIVFQGEIDCTLDNGVVVHLKPGDTCVQRGTVHKWTNNGSVPTRVYFILTAAEPIKIDGKLLGNHGFRDDEVATGGVNE